MAKHRKKSNTQVLSAQEVQNLMEKIAAPLVQSAKSPTQKEAACELAKSLWMALITGPKIEENIFQMLSKNGVDSAGIKVIQDIYYLKMKPIVTEDEIKSLKIRYKVKEKKITSLEILD